MIILEHHDLRQRISALFNAKFTDLSRVVARHAECDLVIEELPRNMQYEDCQTWAFRELKLPQHGNTERGLLTTKLRQGGIPELEQIDGLEERSLVAYSKGPRTEYLHFGVGTFEGRGFSVRSIFGEDGLLVRHAIYAVPFHFGDNIDFYRLKRD